MLFLKNFVQRILVFFFIEASFSIRVLTIMYLDSQLVLLSRSRYFLVRSGAGTGVQVWLRLHISFMIKQTKFSMIFSS